MVHSFLMIGQSNMAGRGFLEEAPEIDTTHIKMLRNGYWVNMFRPVNPDRRFSGTSLAESFAEKYAKVHGVDVGLIPCADGGTCLDKWQEGSILFDHACYMAELASRNSEIKGILWHQGESDCPDDKYPFYEVKLSLMIDAFRKKPYLKDIPFIVGGLGEYLMTMNENPVYQNAGHINRALQNIAATKKMISYVSPEGLTSNPDNLHFNAKSLYEFGLRYFEEYEKYEKYIIK